MDLQKVVNEKMEEMTSNGSIEKMVEDKLQSCIKDALDSAMSFYGDFSKAIQEKIKESIDNSLSAVTFPEYNDVMAKTALETYSNLINEEAAKAINAAFKDELKPVPDEITFDELSDTVKEFWREACSHEDEINLTWDVRSDECVEVKFNHPEYDFNSISVTFYNFKSDDGFRIGYVDSDGTSTGKASSATRLFTGLEGYLFKLYSNRTTFTDLMDSVDENIYVSDY